MTSPTAACETVSSILRQLANLGIADSILPLNLLERSQHLRCAAFDPPKPLYLLLGSHALLKSLHCSILLDKIKM